MTESREQLVDAEYEPPQGPLETTVAHILAEILDVDRIGRSDSFYNFGGTSLQAIRICTRIGRQTRRHVNPASPFEFETLSEFVSQGRVVSGVRAVPPKRRGAGPAELLRAVARLEAA